MGGDICVGASSALSLELCEPLWADSARAFASQQRRTKLVFHLWCHFVHILLLPRESCHVFVHTCGVCVQRVRGRPCLGGGESSDPNVGQAIIHTSVESQKRQAQGRTLRVKPVSDSEVSGEVTWHGAVGEVLGLTLDGHGTRIKDVCGCGLAWEPCTNAFRLVAGWESETLSGARCSFQYGQEGIAELLV